MARFGTCGLCWACLPGKIGGSDTIRFAEGRVRAALTTNDSSPEPPGWWERASCIMVGVIAGGAGGYVAFERSNQLGSAVLLAIGALFLVIGIQGTRLMRFTSGSNSVELEQKKQIITDAINKAQDEGNDEKASGIAAGAAIVVPALGDYSEGLQYEVVVSGVISRMGYHVTRHDFAGQQFDLTIGDGAGRKIYAELKRHLRPLPRNLIEALLYRSKVTRTPVLLITYSELTRGAREIVKSSENFEVVQWRDGEDNPRLKETLRRMFASISLD